MSLFSNTILLNRICVYMRFISSDKSKRVKQKKIPTFFGTLVYLSQLGTYYMFYLTGLRPHLQFSVSTSLLFYSWLHKIDANVTCT